MTKTDRDSEAFGGTRRTVRRARWRMGLLELVMLGVIVGAAVAGGRLVAALLHSMVEAPVGPTWVITSLLLFVVPAAAQLLKAARASQARRTESEPAKEEY